MKASHPSYKMDSVVRQPSDPSGVPISTKQLCTPGSTAPRNCLTEPVSAQLPDSTRCFILPFTSSSPPCCSVQLRIHQAPSNLTAQEPRRSSQLILPLTSLQQNKHLMIN